MASTSTAFLTNPRNLEDGNGTHSEKPRSVLSRITGVHFELAKEGEDTILLPFNQVIFRRGPPLHVEKRLCPCEDPKRKKTRALLDNRLDHYSPIPPWQYNCVKHTRIELRFKFIGKRTVHDGRNLHVWGDLRSRCPMTNGNVFRNLPSTLQVTPRPSRVRAACLSSPPYLKVSYQPIYRTARTCRTLSSSAVYRPCSHPQVRLASRDCQIAVG